MSNVDTSIYPVHSIAGVGTQKESDMRLAPDAFYENKLLWLCTVGIIALIAIFA